MTEQNTPTPFAPLDFSDFRQRLPMMPADETAFIEATKILEEWSKSLIERLAKDWDERQATLINFDKRITVLRAYVELDNQIVNGIASLINQRAKIVRQIERQFPELYNHEAKDGKSTDPAESTLQEPTAPKDGSGI